MRQIACLLLVALQMSAAPRSWNNVKAVTPGSEVRITGPGPGIIQGTLQSVTDDALVLTSSASQQSYPRQQITRVTVTRKGHRLRNTLIGLGLGAGAGVAIGAGADHGCAAHGCIIGNNLGKDIFTPIGAVLGAIVGAVIPTGGWHEVYKQ